MIYRLDDCIYSFIGRKIVKNQASEICIDKVFLVDDNEYLLSISIGKYGKDEFLIDSNIPFDDVNVDKITRIDNRYDGKFDKIISLMTDDEVKIFYNMLEWVWTRKI